MIDDNDVRFFRSLSTDRKKMLAEQLRSTLAADLTPIIPTPGISIRPEGTVSEDGGISHAKLLYNAEHHSFKFFTKRVNGSAQMRVKYHVAIYVTPMEQVDSAHPTGRLLSRDELRAIGMQVYGHVTGSSTNDLDIIEEEDSISAYTTIDVGSSAVDGRELIVSFQSPDIFAALNIRKDSVITVIADARLLWKDWEQREARNEKGTVDVDGVDVYARAAIHLFGQ